MVAEPEYERRTYGTGFALSVEPRDRTMDVLHYLICGCVPGDRNLDGVTWEKIVTPNAKARESALKRAMRFVD